MDPNVQPNSQNPLSQAAEQLVKQESKSFPKLIFFLLGFLLLGVSASISYYLGKNQLSATVSSTTSIIQKVSPTPEQANYFLENTPIPTATTSTIVTGGGFSNLNKYSLTVPDNWNITRETQEFAGKIDSEKLTFSRENSPDYTFSILQGGGDGGICNYPDNKITTGVIDGDYSIYTQFKDKDGNTYRRGETSNTGNLPGKRYIVCQLDKDVFTNLTTYGWIVYTSTKNPNEEILSEMDSILSSLKRQ